jgi:hypothetical protein
MARENWFKQNEEKPDQPRTISSQKDGKQIIGQKSNKKITVSTVMFIPNTRNGLLLKMMRENEEKLTEMTGF